MITMAHLMSLRLARLSRLPTAEEVLEWFSVLQAGWVHDGNPARAHAILHSKKHSNGFFLCKRVLQHGNLREILAECLIEHLRANGMGGVGGVFGSPYSSILLAGDVGRLLGVKTYVPEKDPTDPNGKRMLFKPDDPIPEGSSVLQVEELITTFDSADATRQAVISGNPYPIDFYPLVGVLIHRPKEINNRSPDGRIIVPFIERQVDAWEPNECPLCKAGSKAVLPKTQWAELTA